jgi:hypothetical protein
MGRYLQMTPMCIINALHQTDIWRYLELIGLWNRRIKENVPKERLLVMRLGDGWEPLCKFLGKPVPDEPFPWANDGATADKIAARVMAGLVMRWLVILATTAAVPYTAYWAYKHFGGH